jgi:hypothetical protein
MVSLNQRLRGHSIIVVPLLGSAGKFSVETVSWGSASALVTILCSTSITTPMVLDGIEIIGVREVGLLDAALMWFCLCLGGFQVQQHHWLFEDWGYWYMDRLKFKGLNFCMDAMLLFLHYIFDIKQEFVKLNSDVGV